MLLAKFLSRAKLALFLVLTLQIVTYPAIAVELPIIAASNIADSTNNGTNQKERQKIEELLRTIETDWNNHNLEAVMNYYADDYINNDGLNKKAVAALTEDFWKTYPDAKSFSKTREIRIAGPFVTVESCDTATGTTAKEMPGIGSKGDLQSTSEGQLYLKHLGNGWKIIGDRIDYEKVRVAFGLAKQLDTSFSAPEQVKAGHQYTAQLEVNLPPGLTAVGSITSQPLQYPQPQPADAWRPLEGSLLERVLGANAQNRNELLMATVGITNSSRNSLMGIEFLTRRLNVVPNMPETTDTAAGTSDLSARTPKLPAASPPKDSH